MYLSVFPYLNKKQKISKKNQFLDPGVLVCWDKEQTAERKKPKIKDL